MSTVQLVRVNNWLPYGSYSNNEHECDYWQMLVLFSSQAKILVPMLLHIL